MVLPADVVERVTSYIQHQATKPRDAIVDLVSTAQARYLDVIANVPGDVAEKKPAPEEWSIRELTRHVISAEEGVTRMVAALGRGEHVDPRSGIGAMVEDDGRPFAEYVAHLRTANAALLEAILAVPEQPDINAKMPHPFFGPLNCLEWAAFQRVHDADHEQHANKILAAVSA
jgi:hypothetical protein